ncbi:MAG: hypothetical protein ABJC88_16960 [Parasphingorhabdus sp.]|uniref:hypothetical protein n=1 Tax=Sphingomonadales TaxID=204457 RepID=UPI0032634F1E
MDDLEAQGFIKHDGGGVPDGYELSNMVDAIYNDGNEVVVIFSFLDAINAWDKITHHRRHISDKEQIDMALHCADDVAVLLSFIKAQLCDLDGDNAELIQFIEQEIAPVQQENAKVFNLLKQRNPQ